MNPSVLPLLYGEEHLVRNQIWLLHVLPVTQTPRLGLCLGYRAWEELQFPFFATKPPRVPLGQLLDSSLVRNNNSFSVIRIL